MQRKQKEFLFLLHHNPNSLTGGVHTPLYTGSDQVCNAEVLFCVCVCVCMCARVCARTHPNVCKKLFVYRGKQVRAHIMIGEYCNSSISPIAAAPIIS